jgi:hypothetical protein
MYPVLHALVVKHMLHGSCGTLKKFFPCMIDGECRFLYHEQFCDATQQGRTHILSIGGGMMVIMLRLEKQRAGY